MQVSSDASDALLRLLSVVLPLFLFALFAQGWSLQGREGRSEDGALEARPAVDVQHRAELERIAILPHFRRPAQAQRQALRGRKEDKAKPDKQERGLRGIDPTGYLGRHSHALSSFFLFPRSSSFLLLVQFGEVVHGLEVLDIIEQVDVDSGGVPKKPITIVGAGRLDQVEGEPAQTTNKKR